MLKIIGTDKGTGETFEATEAELRERLGYTYNDANLAWAEFIRLGKTETMFAYYDLINN